VVEVSILIMDREEAVQIRVLVGLGAMQGVLDGEKSEEVGLDRLHSTLTYISFF
jgi:hypothetical protein